MSTRTIQYFAYAHLPAKLQEVSKPIGDLAQKLNALLPDGPEKSAGMRKLLESKDCFVRAAMSAEMEAPQLERAFLGTGERGSKGQQKPDAVIADADAAPIGLKPADIEAAIVATDYHVLPGTTVTVCMLTLRNGAKEIGFNYGAIDPAQQNWKTGEQAARAMAVEKVWEKEGYLLRDQLYREQNGFIPVFVGTISG